ncbi:hypothetical protein [Paenibacillus sp. DYY-L-2]|uniref:hypothetical protein n=1 Tax=Paenibacillus sp. DYY-L-2 TaxID=3447013 RepID=UPI003F508197
MGRVKRRGILYGILLVAGITLGMQLSDSGSAEQTDYWRNGWYSPYVYNNVIQPGQTGQTGVFNPTPNPGYGNPGGATGYGTGNGAGYGTGGDIGSVRDYTANYGVQPNGSRVQTPADLLMPEPEPPAVDRFADKTAGLLQQLSQKGIHWFASLFGPSNE